MEIQISILIAQALNFLVLLLLFKRLVGDKITKAIVHRRKELAKAEGASQIYEEIMLRAQEEKKELIEEGLLHKNKLIEEAKLSAQHKADAIVVAAEKQVEIITKKAEEKAAKLEVDLKNGFVDGVKKTTHVVIKKLFAKDISLQEQYLDELVNEFSS